MANWYGTARSNYFRVRDVDAFTAALEVTFGTAIEVSAGANDMTGFICLLDVDGEGWPICFEPCTDFTPGAAAGLCAGCGCEHPAGGAPRRELVEELIADHLIEGDVAVLLEVGAEKLRYLTGTAVAVNSRGEHVGLSLDEVYQRAAQLGETITTALY